MKIAAKVIEIPTKLTNHLVGENHTMRHRKITGVFIIMVGVIVAKSGNLISIHIIHYLCDAVGYLIHGIGTIPFVEQILNSQKHEE